VVIGQREKQTHDLARIPGERRSARCDAAREPLTGRAERSGEDEGGDEQRPHEHTGFDVSDAALNPALSRPARVGSLAGRGYVGRPREEPACAVRFESLRPQLP
jgi:hypothetical protein